MNVTTDIEELGADGAALAVDELAEVLHACVLEGASVGFVLPFEHEAALRFWRGLLPAFQSGARRLLVARREGRIEGTVQLLLDMPANGRHRAEVAKMLVHPRARRQGLARALMEAAEALARRHGRSLLLLDTVTGNPAEQLYRSLGFHVAGVVPGYARSTQGVLEPTTVMYKALSPAGTA
jgi:GNAT superfamily N-acetyltransferase